MWGRVVLSDLKPCGYLATAACGSLCVEVCVETPHHLEEPRCSCQFLCATFSEVPLDPDNHNIIPVKMLIPILAKEGRDPSCHYAYKYLVF